MTDSVGFVIEEFAAVENRPILRGIVRVRTPSGVVFHDITICGRNGAVWAKPGARARLDQQGRQMRDADGRRLWTPVITFASRETEDQFSHAVIDALRAAHPELFGVGGSI